MGEPLEAVRKMVDIGARDIELKVARRRGLEQAGRKSQSAHLTADPAVDFLVDLARSLANRG